MTDHLSIHHLSLRNGDLYTCPACAWRAVQTTRGLVVTAYGDAQASHHAGYAPSADERRAWVEQIVTRLRALHGALEPEQIARLMRCVESEYEE